MTRDIASAQVRAALIEVLPEKPDRLEEQHRLFEDLGLDSTAIIELLLALENTADIEIDPDELSAGVFASVGSLTDYVETKLTAVR